MASTITAFVFLMNLFNPFFLVSVVAAVHIEGIVLQSISRNRKEKEYKFEVGKDPA